MLRFGESKGPVPEVNDMARRIKEAFNDLEFDEGAHRYTLNGKAFPLTASGVSKLFIDEPDWDIIKKCCAKKQQITLEALERDWHEKNIRSTNAGTRTHEFGEAYMHFMKGEEEYIKSNPQYEDGYLIPCSPKQEAIEKYWADVNKANVYPVLPEVQMYYKDQIAGTADIILACEHKGRWGLLIHDYKTNKDIYNKYTRAHKRHLKAPFESLYEEPYSEYTIQLSVYQMMLEEALPGVPVFDRALIWLKDDGTYEKIRVPDVTKTLKETLTNI